MKSPPLILGDVEGEIPEVLLRLRQHWWCALDDQGYDIPLLKVDQVNALGESPIHIAARSGKPEDLLWLIENGADINQRGDFEMRPLHYAYMSGNTKNIAVLLNAGADPDARCDRGLRPDEGRPIPRKQSAKDRNMSSSDHQGTTTDKHGTKVSVGSVVRVLSVQESLFQRLSENEQIDVKEMIGHTFAVYEIDAFGCAWVEKWWHPSEEEAMSHSIALDPDDMEVVVSESS